MKLPLTAMPTGGIYDADGNYIAHSTSHAAALVRIINTALAAVNADTPAAVAALLALLARVLQEAETP
jgi:hypothetical protein